MPDTPYTFSHSEYSEAGLLEEARKLEEEGADPNDAMVIAAATMDGAGDNPKGTVESMQTCRTLFGEAVKGLTTSDIPRGRQDEFAESEGERHTNAEENKDLGALWLTLSNISVEGMVVANKITELVTENQKELDRFWNDIHVCVDRDFTDQEIIETLSKILEKNQ